MRLNLAELGFAPSKFGEAIVAMVTCWRTYVCVFDGRWVFHE